LISEQSRIDSVEEGFAMKHLVFLSLIVATLIAPVRVQAQQTVTIEQPADCALGLIKFEAAVTGLGDFVVTPDILQIWRAHLASMYPRLPPYHQAEYGPQACGKLSWLMNTFPQLPASQREQYERVWAESLPVAFQLLVNPVLLAAQEAQQARQAQQAQQNPACALQGNPEAELKYLLANPTGRLCGPQNSDPAGTARLVEKGLNQGASNTLDMMRVMEPRPYGFCPPPCAGK
jgi:hypothetical protein